MATTEQTQRWEALGGKIEEKPRGGSAKGTVKTYITPTGGRSLHARHPRAPMPSGCALRIDRAGTARGGSAPAWWPNTSSRLMARTRV